MPLNEHILHVDNLPAHLHRRRLSELLKTKFERYGKVLRCDVPTPRRHNPEYLFGFVCMKHKDDAEDAINGLNRVMFEGKRIIVKHKLHKGHNHNSSNDEVKLSRTDQDEINLVEMGDVDQIPGKSHKSSGKYNNDEVISAEIEINDIPETCRRALITEEGLNEVKRISGAEVFVRGRYRSPEEIAAYPNSREKSLYLLIEGTTQDSVNAAIGKVQYVIQTKTDQQIDLETEGAPVRAPNMGPRLLPMPPRMPPIPLAIPPPGVQAPFAMRPTFIPPPFVMGPSGVPVPFGMRQPGVPPQFGIRPPGVQPPFATPPYQEPPPGAILPPQHLFPHSVPAPPVAHHDGRASISGPSLQPQGEITEVDINDVPLVGRDLLTDQFTLSMIRNMSGASVTVQGRYMLPSEKSKAVRGSGDSPLHLVIEGPTYYSVQLAHERIQTIIANANTQRKKKSRFSDEPPQGAQANVKGAKVMKIYLDDLSNLPGFNLKERLLGVSNSHFKHIQSESKAEITLQGIGSGNLSKVTGREIQEPLYVHITHSSLPEVEKAKCLVESLISTVRNHYLQLKEKMRIPDMSTAKRSHENNLDLALPYQHEIGAEGVQRPDGYPVASLRPKSPLMNKPPSNHRTLIREPENINALEEPRKTVRCILCDITMKNFTEKEVQGHFLGNEHLEKVQNQQQIDKRVAAEKVQAASGYDRKRLSSELNVSPHLEQHMGEKHRRITTDDTAYKGPSLSESNYKNQADNSREYVSPYDSDAHMRRPEQIELQQQDNYDQGQRLLPENVQPLQQPSGASHDRFIENSQESVLSSLGLAPEDLSRLVSLAQQEAEMGGSDEALLENLSQLQNVMSSLAQHSEMMKNRSSGMHFTTPQSPAVTELINNPSNGMHVNAPPPPNVTKFRNMISQLMESLIDDDEDED